MRQANVANPSDTVKCPQVKAPPHLEGAPGLPTLPMWDGSLDDYTQVAVLRVAVAPRQTLASLCVMLSSSRGQNPELGQVAEACWHGLCQP